MLPRHVIWPRLALAAVCGVLLLFDLASLCADSSRVGAALGHKCNHGATHYVHAWASRTEDGIVVSEEIPDPLSTNPVAELMVPSGNSTGFWAPTRFTMNYYILRDYTHVSPPPLTQSERAQIRDGWVRFLRDSYYNERFTAKIEAGIDTESGILWSGYRHNAYALALLAGAIWPLATLPRAVRRNRLHLGLCPNCKYPICAFRCPECGAETPAY